MTGLRFCLVAAILASPLLARAQQPASAPPSGPPTASWPEDETEEPPPLIPPAGDTLGGHFLARAGALVNTPFLKLDNHTDFSDSAVLGLGVSGDLGIGLSRHLVLGAWGDYSAFGKPSDCSSCKASSFGVGPFVRYQLVQGMRFDPWLALGIGYRRTSSRTAAESYDYSGIEWLKLALGGDWYALSQFGFGPYAELAFGSYTDRPTGRDAAVYGTFSFGLRVVLDPRGK